MAQQPRRNPKSGGGDREQRTDAPITRIAGEQSEMTRMYEHFVRHSRPDDDPDEPPIPYPDDDDVLYTEGLPQTGGSENERERVCSEARRLLASSRHAIIAIAADDEGKQADARRPAAVAALALHPHPHTLFCTHVGAESQVPRSAANHDLIAYNPEYCVKQLASLSSDARAAPVARMAGGVALMLSQFLGRADVASMHIVDAAALAGCAPRPAINSGDATARAMEECWLLVDILRVMASSPLPDRAAATRAHAAVQDVASDAAQRIERLEALMAQRDEKIRMLNRDASVLIERCEKSEELARKVGGGGAATSVIGHGGTTRDGIWFTRIIVGSLALTCFAITYDAEVAWKAESHALTRYADALESMRYQVHDVDTRWRAVMAATGARSREEVPEAAAILAGLRPAKGSTPSPEAFSLRLPLIRYRIHTAIRQYGRTVYLALAALFAALFLVSLPWRRAGRFTMRVFRWLWRYKTMPFRLVVVPLHWIGRGWHWAARRLRSRADAIARAREEAAALAAVEKRRREEQEREEHLVRFREFTTTIQVRPTWTSPALLDTWSVADGITAVVVRIDQCRVCGHDLTALAFRLSTALVREYLEATRQQSADTDASRPRIEEFILCDRINYQGFVADVRWLSPEIEQMTAKYTTYRMSRVPSPNGDGPYRMRYANNCPQCFAVIPDARIRPVADSGPWVASL